MRVLIVDDHDLFRIGLTYLLETGGFTVVGQAGDGQAAIQEVRELNPDLVLLDIHMPGMNGLEALRKIREVSPAQMVVMLTALEEQEYLLQAIQSGAQGYLLKTLNSRSLLASLRGLQRGEMAISRRASRRVIETLVGLSEEADQGMELSLTPREISLLERVADGLSNKAIAEVLSISENTVKWHMHKILRKLEVTDRTKAVVRANRLGILGGGPDVAS